MKKTTIYTLLCTTIMIPSMSMAAQRVAELKDGAADTAAPGTPTTTRINVLQRELDALPATPKFEKDAEAKYTNEFLSSPEVKAVRASAAAAARSERDQTAAALKAERGELASKKNLVSAKAQIESERAEFLRQMEEADATQERVIVLEAEAERLTKELAQKQAEEKTKDAAIKRERELKGGIITSQSADVQSLSAKLKAKMVELQAAKDLLEEQTITIERAKVLEEARRDFFARKAGAAKKEAPAGNGAAAAATTASTEAIIQDPSLAPRPSDDSTARAAAPASVQTPAPTPAPKGRTRQTAALDVGQTANPENKH